MMCINNICNNASCVKSSFAVSFVLTQYWNILWLLHVLIYLLVDKNHNHRHCYWYSFHLSVSGCYSLCRTKFLFSCLHRLYTLKLFLFGYIVLMVFGVTFQNKRSHIVNLSLIHILPTTPNIHQSEVTWHLAGDRK